MNAPAILTEYVYERMETEPVARRILLTEALAEIAPTQKEKIALLDHCAALKQIEVAHRQLVFTFRANRPAA